MTSIRVLALSSSRVGNAAYLQNAIPVIHQFLGDKPLKAAFIPFAAADNNYENYLAKVQEGLSSLPYTIQVVTPGDSGIIEEAEVIVVGGGNTFKLLHHIYEYGLFQLIKDKVNGGIPYVGWSAGSNITGLTIGTTNDMPIIEPKSFKAFGFFPFQINPHYINVKPEGHNGETRDERLTEYLKVNPSAKIVGLPEGTALQLDGNMLKLVGEVPGVLFSARLSTMEVERGTIKIEEDITYLMQQS